MKKILNKNKILNITKNAPFGFSSIKFGFVTYDCIPKPGFVTHTIHAGLDIDSVVDQIGSLLPQLSNFIDQFNNIVIKHDINVVTDSYGFMSADVPENMKTEDAQFLSKKIGVLDSLISSRKNTLSDLFKEGTALENNLKTSNPNYVSRLTDHMSKFEILKNSYNH